MRGFSNFHECQSNANGIDTVLFFIIAFHVLFIVFSQFRLSKTSSYEELKVETTAIEYYMMAIQNDSNTLILGGFKFSKLQNRKKGILVTSIDPEDSATSIVISSKESSPLNESSQGVQESQSRVQRRNSEHQAEKKELEAKALLFCKVVHKLLQEQNFSTFVGSEVIYKMVSSGLSKNRAEALALGKELSKKLRLFYRVEFMRNTFSDDGKLYKFRPDVLLSVITKSPMCIQKLDPVEDDRRLKSEPTATSDVSDSPMKFRRYVPKSNGTEVEEEEISVPMGNFIGSLAKRGRRPGGLHMIPQDQSQSSEEEWKYGNRATMNSIHETEIYSEDEDQSMYTEITLTDHQKDVSSFPPVPAIPREEDETSYMEFTVSTRSRDADSYFDEFTLEDEDEYDIMAVPTTPVVRQKINVRSKGNIPMKPDLFSPSDVQGFDKCVPQQATKHCELSLSTRVRGGEFDIAIPYLDEDASIADDI